MTNIQETEHTPRKRLRCCVIALALLVFVGAVLLIAALCFYYRMSLYTLRIENRSSRDIYQMNVLWPNGTYSKFDSLKIGDDVRLTYLPGEDGHARLLFIVYEDERPIRRYAEPGGYLTTSFGYDEEWVIHDGHVDVVGDSGTTRKEFLLNGSIRDEIEEIDTENNGENKSK